MSRRVKAGHSKKQADKVTEEIRREKCSKPAFQQKWFPLNTATDKNTRHREKYALRKTNQERWKNGTLNFMRRHLNELNK